MNQRTSKRRRTPVRVISVADEVRRAIVRGKWSPGEFLPVRKEFERRFDVSPTTLQRAMDRLRAEGFIETVSTSGTRVAPRPPHLHNYALVYSRRPKMSTDWRRLWHMLEANRTAVEDDCDVRLRPYFMDAADTASDGPAALVDDAARRRLAGVVFAYPPGERDPLTPLHEASVPCVAISSSPREDMATAGFDFEAALDLCAAQASEQGRPRAALIHSSTLFSYHPGLEAAWQESAQRHGLQTPPHWSVPVDLDEFQGARRLVQLLFTGDRDSWPDSLIIQDDNFVAPLMAGLVERGVRAPDDVLLVAVVNEPDSVSAVMPVTCVVFDPHELLRECLEVLRAGRADGPHHHLLAPRLKQRVGPWLAHAGPAPDAGPPGRANQ